MAEAVLSIGLAANIAQFVGYGISIVAETREIYYSARGAKEENLELERVIYDVQKFNDQICASALSCSGIPMSADEGAIRNLAIDCQPLVDKILGVLKTLQARNSRTFPKLEAFRKALRSAVKKGEIEDLVDRLRAIEDQITLHLINLLRNDQSATLTTVRSLNENTKQIETTLEKRFADLNAEIGHMMRQQLQNLSTTISMVIEQNDKATRQREIIERLSFDEIQRRYSDIKDAYEKTLQWMYSDPEIGFQEWLERGTGVYWVTGKAGSGKSTLMKYAFDHDNTKEALKAWAGSGELVTASHYFWNVGSPIQRSHEGLLRSLLYQIFRSCPTFLTESYVKGPQQMQWTVRELQNLLEMTIKEGTSKVKFCFFIDGLDEYEGDATDIVNYVRRLAVFTNLKLCVSSRPWSAFQIALGETRFKLQLETLTQDDMKAYIQKSLTEDYAFRKLADDGLRCEDLISDIARKAKGVWLWVYLVVRDLLRDVRKSEENFDDLHRRLNAVPSELRDYFKRVLDNLDPLHREETARILLVLLENEGDFPLQALEGLEMDVKNPGQAIGREIQPLEEEDFVKLARKWQSRLSNRCKDLLEVYECQVKPSTRSRPISVSLHRVDFLHKTVRDFLTENWISKLRVQVDSTFDPRIYLGRSMLYYLKIIPPIQRIRFSRLAGHDIAKIMLLSRKLKCEGNFAVYLLDELDRAMSMRSQGWGNHWAVEHLQHMHREFYFFENGMLRRESVENAFFVFAMWYDQRTYLAHKFDHVSSGMMDTFQCPLLGYAFSQMVAHGANRRILLIVGFLLEKGANPNQMFQAWGGGTVWAFFLVVLFALRGQDPVKTENAYKMAEMMIDYGADFGVQFDGAVEWAESIARSDPSESSIRFVRGLKHHHWPAPANLSSMLSVVFTPHQSQRLQAKIVEIAVRRSTFANASAYESFTYFSRFQRTFFWLTYRSIVAKYLNSSPGPLLP